ncbi:adenosine deaminase [soil metagenome]
MKIQPPKIDLHRHLDGNIRVATILELAESHGIELPACDVETLKPYVTVMEPVPSLVTFLEKFRWSVGVLADPAACRRIAYENVEDAHREGLKYVELRFSPWFMAQAFSLDAEAVVEATLQGLHEGRRDFQVGVEAIGILSRTFGTDICWKELDALLAYKNQFTAIDLAGDEHGYPAALFQKHFAKVRDQGLRVTIHAGEAAGAQSIWDSIELLGAERIGHGIRAIDDPELMDFLAENKIGLECCPTSNVQTSTVPDYASHPLRKFLEWGLLATINTDDPGISGIDLDYELTQAAPAVGLSPEQIIQAQWNAAEIAFAKF